MLRGSRKAFTTPHAPARTHISAGAGEASRGHVHKGGVACLGCPLSTRRGPWQRETPECCLPRPWAALA